MAKQPFVSEAAKQYQIFNDSNWRDASQWERGDQPNPGDDQCSQSGFIPRDWELQPLGTAPGSVEFPSNMLWPKETWKERIQELEATGQNISARIKKAFAEGKFLCLNQNPTNYCWCYGYIHGLLINRLLANEPFVRLSPYSLACLIKNFQNQGGWGSQACERSYTDGVADEKYWPQERPGMSSSERSAANMNAIRNGRQYLEASRQNAALHKTAESWDLRPRNYEEKISTLLIPLPVASGYNRIGHERCSTDAVILSNGDIGCLDLDSYTSDGNFDGKVCSSSQSLADDAVVPRVPSPSDV